MRTAHGNIDDSGLSWWWSPGRPGAPASGEGLEGTDPDLTPRARREGGRLVIELPPYPYFLGEDEARAHRGRLERLFDPDAEEWQIDLRYNRRASSFLLTTLVLLYRKVQGGGVRIALSNVDVGLQRVLQSAGMDGLFDAIREGT